MSLMFQRPNTFGEAAFYPYKINQSCRFNDNNSSYMGRTPTIATNITTWTFNTWVKRANIGMAATKIFEAYYYGGLTYRTQIMFVNDKFRFLNYRNGSITTQKDSSAYYRDIGSWFNLHVVWDTTNGNIEDRCRIYINNERITSWTANNTPTASEQGMVNNTCVQYIGKGNTANYWDGYLSETRLIDGQALDPEDFAQSKYGIWIPKEYTSSYGTNGFYLDFADSADLGNDVSGNNNDFTSSGLTSDDQVLDSPTNNYATLNNIDPLALGVAAEGNLQKQTTGASIVPTNFVMPTMMIPKTGKWYCEVIYVANTSSRACYGVCNSFRDKYDFIFAFNGNHYNESTNVAYGNTWTVEQIGIAVDMDNETLTLYISNVSQGVIDISGRYGDEDLFFAFADGSGSYYITFLANFGQLGFTYTPPTGYKALCSNNLPTPSIKDSSTGFDVVLYEGNATIRDITDLSFQPDLVWIKNRDQADEYKLIDSVRGATKELSSNNSAVEGTNANGLTAFLSNGFSLGTGAAGYNDNAESFVAWCFRMGVKYGFDIQKYTGTGIAHAENHNLGGVPELMIVKNLETAANWPVYHHHALNKTDPETDYGLLNVNTAWNDNNTVWNDTFPTLTQFTVGTDSSVNQNLKDHIAYLWRSIEGFSKVFSYTGNNNANGPFVYCGFKPRYIMIKASNNAQGWVLIDTERDIYNPCENRFYADVSSVEGVDVNTMDILSNGFKLRNSLGRTNSAFNYVGIAISEQSSKWSNSR